MNEHQKTAAYVLEKMRSVGIPGEESELHSQAKQWLALIVNGQFNVEENSDDGDGKPVGIVRDTA